MPEIEVVTDVMAGKAKLTEKQKRFADYYIETGNGTESAIKAGYSQKIARVISVKNLKKPLIKAYIASRLKAIEDERIASAKEVLQFLTSSMRGEVKEEVVVVEGVGDGCSEARILKKHIGANDRIKAAVQLAKRYGLDKPQEEGVDDGPVIITGEENLPE